LSSKISDPLSDISGHASKVVYLGLAFQDAPSEEDKQLAESARVCLHPDFACHLLASCVQGAVARIQDGAGANGRSTHRIALLLHCLENRG